MRRADRKQIVLDFLLLVFIRVPPDQRIVSTDGAACMTWLAPCPGEESLFESPDQGLYQLRSVVSMAVEPLTIRPRAGLGIFMCRVPKRRQVF